MSQQWAGLDKGKGKMLEYEVNHPNESDLDVSAHSLDNEFGVPIMWTLGVKKALTLTTEKLRHLSREKNPITWFSYNEYMSHHYAFMMKVEAEQKPESCIEATRDPRCMTTMDEEMQAVGLRPFNTTSLRHSLEGEEPKLSRKGQRKPEQDKTRQGP